MSKKYLYCEKLNNPKKLKLVSKPIKYILSQTTHQVTTYLNEFTISSVEIDDNWADHISKAEIFDDYVLANAVREVLESEFNIKITIKNLK